ncbi:Major facilitator superfamily domain general substrate transporter [Penicillium coprophilum]|uniref:Major facilitator superfamily domain general substrate transporter n=1 Tax=Penicillium coprophilum TaxID=36646 RepID=UPI00239007B5|nr:Major facilitator superfamily domain general substrate transporter [Penicillium coprophilum]KAJ5171258.1 Major facilitator superfamily domain general substrate transporter [Penicillium coprophilum]
MASFELQPNTSRRDELEEVPGTKADIDLIESAGYGGEPTHAESMTARLPKAHRDYLMERHGTLELDPIPGMSPADPYNWSERKKMINLVLVAFHACMGTFTAAAIIPAFLDLSKALGVGMQDVAYLTSLQIAILGGAPLFWKPLSNRAVVMETTFKKDRGRYMGVWTLMVTLGVPIGPFIFGFVAYRAGYQWIFWILAMINGGQFILYLFFGPETRYLDSGIDSKESTRKIEYMSLRRIDPAPFSWFEFVRPLTMARHPSILIPACAYAMIFLFASVLTTVEVPQLLQEKFELNSEQLGMQFLGVIIGSVIGEQMGGVLSDFWMSRRSQRINRKAEPEFRLWLSYFGFALTIIGVIIFLVCTQESPSGHWSVSPIVGTAIAAVGNQLVTTVMVTYAVDCFPQEAGNIGVFVTFVRQIWGFIGPFWFTPMFENAGIAPSAGIVSALIVLVSVIPTIFLHWRGKIWRSEE